MSALPSVRTGKTATHRVVLKTESGAVYVPHMLVIDGDYAGDPGNTNDLDVLRAGMLLGKNSTSEKYEPSIVGVTAGALAASGTTVSVSAAQAVELDRMAVVAGGYPINLTITGPPTAGGTVADETLAVSAIDTSTGALTFSACTNAYIAGSFIGLADGSQTPMFILTDGYGLKVTDENDTRIDVSPQKVVMGGVIDSSQILNWPTDTSLVAWIKEKLRDVGQGYVFDDDVP